MNLKMILIISVGIFFTSCQDTPVKSYTARVEVQIKNMVESASQYLMQNGTLPSDCWEQMYEMGYLDISSLDTELWDFECSWEWDESIHSILGVVIATSKRSNPAGSGQVIEYYIEDRSFAGYGQ